MSATSKDCVNNLSSEGDHNSTKLQRNDDASNVQHTTKSATAKNE